MAEMFRLLKELTTSRAPEKVLIREEAKSLVTKNVNSISLAREEEERNNNDDMAADDGINRIDTEMPINEAEEETEAKKGTKNKPIKRAEREGTAEASSSQPIDIRLSLASHSYIYPLGIAEDVLVDVAGYVYPVDFMILDIKEDKKRPFILGTPFLTTAKAVIRFDKGTITLRSGKSKISFHRIPESLRKVEKGIKNDIEPVAPTMSVNRLVLEWEEKIKLH
ncbi:MAK10-like protein [Tanacetum coccineum]